MRALCVEMLSMDLSGCAIRNIPRPHLGAGEVLVKIEAASVAFPDYLTMQGEYQAKPELPFIPGTDIAGSIVTVAPDVTALKPGDIVAATRPTGGMAEYGVYRQEALNIMPKTLSFAEAAALGSAYLTAYVALVERANLQPGEWLLVHGGTGGVGLAAADLGKALGAQIIIASTSDEKLAAAQKIYPADAYININEGFREKVKSLTNGGADIIFDPIGGDVFDESARCIGFGGRLLIVGFAGGRIATVKTNMPLIKGYSVVGVRAGEYARRFPEKAKDIFATLFEMAAQKRIKPHVHMSFPLDQWREGFDALINRSVIGRAIILPQK